MRKQFNSLSMFIFSYFCLHVRVQLSSFKRYPGSKTKFKFKFEMSRLQGCQNLNVMISIFSPGGVFKKFIQQYEAINAPHFANSKSDGKLLLQHLL